MNIGINGINIKGDKKKTLIRLVEILERKKFKIFYSDTLNKSFSKTTYPNINKKNISIIDYVISFGGDGTLLNTVSLIGKSETKILGVNVGKLGFLSYDVSEVFEQIIEQIIKSNYTLEKRSLVSISNKKEIIKKNFALNEISVIKKDSSSMIKIHCYINNKFICTYWSDGLIISTPTGSTGYSLSNGGSIVSPESNVILLNPIAPHNINMRSLVIPDNSNIKIDIEGDNEVNLSVDSRMYSISSSNQIEISKADFTIKTIKFDDDNFYKRLREKLFWGQDMRNKNINN